MAQIKEDHSRIKTRQRLIITRQFIGGKIGPIMDVRGRLW